MPVNPFWEKKNHADLLICKLLSIMQPAIFILTWFRNCMKLPLGTKQTHGAPHNISNFEENGDTWHLSNTAAILACIINSFNIRSHYNPFGNVTSCKARVWMVGMIKSMYNENVNQEMRIEKLHNTQQVRIFH